MHCMAASHTTRILSLTLWKSHAGSGISLNLKCPRRSTPLLAPKTLKIDALEPFLDVSHLAGFSFDVDEALVLVADASLLGHHVRGNGSDHEPEKIQAIDDFAPLAEVTQVKQFVGSSNWVRRYLAPYFVAAMKILGEYRKPGVKLGPLGLRA